MKQAYTEADGRIVFRYAVKRINYRGGEVIGEFWAEHDDEAEVMFRELYPDAEALGVFCMNENDKEIR